MLTGLTNLGSLASRLLLAVLAVLLGWLAPLHAGGPSPVATDDAPTIQLPAVAPSPVVQVFLVAYRGQGPPVLTPVCGRCRRPLESLRAASLTCRVTVGKRAARKDSGVRGHSRHSPCSNSQLAGRSR